VSGNDDAIGVFSVGSLRQTYRADIPSGAIWVTNACPTNTALFVAGSTNGWLYQYDTRVPSGDPVLSIPVEKGRAMRALYFRDQDPTQVFTSCGRPTMSIWDIRNPDQAPISHIRPPANESVFLRSTLFIFSDPLHVSCTLNNRILIRPD
jgi:hypothetical protein